MGESTSPPRAVSRLLSWIEQRTVRRQAREGRCRVHGRVNLACTSGGGALFPDRTKDGLPARSPAREEDGLVSGLERLQKTFRTELGSVELLRGVKVFDKNTLYL